MYKILKYYFINNRQNFKAKKTQEDQLIKNKANKLCTNNYIRELTKKMPH